MGAEKGKGENTKEGGTDKVRGCVIKSRASQEGGGSSRPHAHVGYECALSAFKSSTLQYALL